MRLYMIDYNDLKMAYFMFCGHTQEESYAMAFEPDNVSKESLHVVASNKVQEKKGIKKLVESLSRVYGSGNQTPAPVEAKGKKKKQGLDVTDKDSILRALKEQYDNAMEPKVKTDILTKIADLQRMKQDENKEEEELTHFYLPLTCKRCKLYDEAMKKKEHQYKQ
jgi:hypothetical protein